MKSLSKWSILSLLLGLPAACIIMGMFGIIPFSDRPLGTRPFKVDSAIYLSFNANSNSDSRSWNLVIDLRSLQKLRPWEMEANGETIVSGVTRFGVIHPGLVEVEYLNSNQSYEWCIVDITKGVNGYEEWHFASKEEVDSKLRKMGIGSPVMLTPLRPGSRVSVGILASILIAVFVPILFYVPQMSRRIAVKLHLVKADVAQQDFPV